MMAWRRGGAAKRMHDRVHLVHLSGPREGQTTVVPSLPAVIGAHDSSDVVIPGVAGRHLRLERRNGNVVLADEGSEKGTLLFGQLVREAVLRDGDVIELGEGGPRLRLVLPDRIARPAPLSATWTRAARHRGLFWLILLAFAISGISIAVLYRESQRLREQVAWLRVEAASAADERKQLEVRVARERARAEEQRLALEAQVREFRDREEELRRQMAAAAPSGEVTQLGEELRLTRERLFLLEDERAAGERIIRAYGDGVCLIQGQYAFFDKDNSALRYDLDDTGTPRRDENGFPVLVTSGPGSIHTIEYFGTGFLVDAKGLVITNRHVAEPWWKDEDTARLAARGFKPHFLSFRAFFPRIREPFALEVARLGERGDVAVVRLDAPPTAVPVLAMATTPQAAVAGQPVVVVGYPTGLDAILAKADPAVVRQILGQHGADSARVTDELSARGLIRPSTTQGHIGDITKTDIVFDAPTTQGGSGGPVFNKNGQVIAVEYAVLSKFGGNAFGVPVAEARALLRAKG